MGVLAKKASLPCYLQSRGSDLDLLRPLEQLGPQTDMMGLDLYSLNWCFAHWVTHCIQTGWSGDEASNGPPATLSGAPAPCCPALSMLGVSLGHPGFVSEPSLFLPVNVWRCKFDPCVGKVPWRRAWKPTPVFLPGESHGQRSLAGYSPWGHKELDTTECAHT